MLNMDIAKLHNTTTYYKYMNTFGYQVNYYLLGI